MGEDMNNKKFIIELKIIINNSLYNKNIVDEDTFTQVNAILLKELKNYNT